MIAAGAPRRRVRALTRLSRGAFLALCVGLAGPVAADERIVSAAFSGPSEAYAHCILGDCVEYSGLEIISRTPGGALVSRSTQLASQPFVFEDIAPRLWDITGDGAPEVVVILTSFTRGASLAVFGVDGMIAQTPYIGRTNRWLAPIGAADFDGDGRIEVAFIDRPHLAKILRVFEWNGRELVPDTELYGLTNHRIGEGFIAGGLRTCNGLPATVTADAQWDNVMVTSFEEGWSSVSVGAYSTDALSDALACRL